MPTTCHSEVGRLQRVYIKHAADVFVSDAEIQLHGKTLNYLEKPLFSKAAFE